MAIVIQGTYIEERKREEKSKKKKKNCYPPTVTAINLRSLTRNSKNVFKEDTAIGQERKGT